MKIKRIIGFAFATTLLFGGLTALSFAQPQNEIAVEEAKAATHVDNFDPYVYSGSYYDGISGTGTTLRSQLTALIFPEGWYTYGSSGADHLSTVLQTADEDPTNSANMIYFYTRESVKKNAASTWNREHVWPQSDSNGCWGKDHAGTDILHIRPTYDSTNNDRGNDLYGDVEGSWKQYNGMPYGKEEGDYFEPLDAAKGDAARICMYVWVAYYNYYGNSLPSITKVFKDFDTMMRWHVLDKPDVLEGNRNDFSETSKQKNRNPFVDHPEYAWKIFGNNCSQTVLDAAKAAYPDGPVETIDVTGVSLNKTSLSLEVGQSETLTATVSPSNATNKKVTWTTDKSSVATVNNGAVTAVGEGTATITITTSDGGFTASCTVTVTPKPKYTISFNANGGTGNMESVSKEAGSHTLPANGFTAPENQEFAGWKVNNTGSLLQPGASITISESTTIYAQWKDITYTVTFNSDGGSPVNSQNIVKGQLATKPADPTRTGYTFLGWFLDENEYNFATPITGDITLVAKWQKDGGGEKQIFTVSFNSNGGSQVDPQQVEEEQKVTKPADPTRDGYDFVGWYVGDTLYDFNTPVSSDFTLFAHWTEKSGGEDPVDPVVVAKLDTSKPLLITAPNKTKYSVGEKIDLTGFKAVATYEDKSTKDVTNSVVLDSVNMDKAGEKIVTLSYTENGRTVRGLFNISVEASSGGGCHGSIIASSAIISLTSLLGVGLILIKKKNK